MTRNILILLIVTTLFACKDRQKTAENTQTLIPFKIIIDSDTSCGGTHSQYILTQDSYTHIYLKDNLVPRDTIMDGVDVLASNDTLISISNVSFDSIPDAKEKEHCGEKFIITKNGQTKSVDIDYQHPQDIICKVATYINTLTVDKYKIDICSRDNGQ